MSRPERIGVAAGVGLALVYTVSLATGAADTLNRKTWFGSGANLIQWASGIAFLLSIVAVVTMHVARSCAAHPWCLRRGEHPVKGTLQKVCRHHHTLDCHEYIYAKHAAEHAASGRLEFGQSHTKETP